MAYEKNGDVFCSPTTVSMLLSHWEPETQAARTGLRCSRSGEGVYDPVWGGTGNGFQHRLRRLFRWMRAYTTRLSDVSELEGFIAKGIPVGLSLCYNRLRGKKVAAERASCGLRWLHQDWRCDHQRSGTSKNVRKTFPRAS